MEYIFKKIFENFLKVFYLNFFANSRNWQFVKPVFTCFHLLNVQNNLLCMHVVRYTTTLAFGFPCKILLKPGLSHREILSHINHLKKDLQKATLRLYKAKMQVCACFFKPHVCGRSGATLWDVFWKGRSGEAIDKEVCRSISLALTDGRQEFIRFIALSSTFCWKDADSPQILSRQALSLLASFF